LSPCFHDRHDAGRRLAAMLDAYRGKRPVVVGIPRGGVPVAAKVARALNAPLDIAVVRKVGAPSNPEYAIGAVAEGGVRLFSEKAVSALEITHAELRALLANAERELDRRLRDYRGAREQIELADRMAILVDDGLATGSTAVAALRSLRARGAKRTILAVPVAASSSARALLGEADEVVSVETPDDMYAVGYWYEDFKPTTDDEVKALLRSSNASHGCE
jgi:putative phosphoribosyl transferase